MAALFPPPSSSPAQSSPLASSSPNHATKSIRSSFDASPAVAEVNDDGDTFYELLSIHLDQPVGSMSISPANRDVALGARKGLYIVDLQNPWDPPRFLPHNSAWEVADVQWNPFPSRSEWVVSTSNQKAVVYNLSLSPSLSVSPIEHILHAHTRAVTDINWSPAAPEILATCALDGWVWSWDLRTGYGSSSRPGGGRKPVWGVCSWGSGATQVKWNRRQPHLIASAHDNRVLIWDERMGAAPVTTIDGHSAKIYGIDWSRRDANRLVTCSLDKSFRSWSITDNVAIPDLTVHTSSPVWRARYLPFGRGVLTLPQRSDHALSIWGRAKIERGDTAQPVARFEGAREGVKEFVWRTRGGDDLNNDDRQFQLVTWSKDRRLRLWPITDEILKEVGHTKGAPIDIQMTRRHCPNISYRTFTEPPAPPLQPLSFTSSPSTIPRHLAPTASLLSASLSASLSTSPIAPSLLTSSLLTAGLANNPFAPPPPATIARRGAATMTTSSVRNRRQKAHDRLLWMEGVKVIKPSLEGEPNFEEQKVTLGRESRVGETRSSSLQRGTDAGTAREGGETERAESLVSAGSKVTGTQVGREATHANLGEEITSVVRRFPRVNFEKVHIAGRTCTVSLYSPMFLRATFTFPKHYPLSAAPSIDLERNTDISLKSRAFLLQSLRKLMASRTQRSLPSFELALRFLLGDRSDLDNKPIPLEEDDDDEGDLAVSAGVTAEILRNNVNVPPPRRGGATFGPRGQLLVFFPTHVFASPTTDKEDSVAAPEATVARPRLPPRSEAFGNLAAGDRDEISEEDYQETDEALLMSTGLSFRPSELAHFRPPLGSPGLPSPPFFSTTVHIKDVSHLTLLTPSRGPSTIEGPPLDIARAALLAAKAEKDLFLLHVWTTMTCFLESGGESTRGSQRKLQTLFSERFLPELLTFLAHLKDVQTLGLIACVLESYRRASFTEATNPQRPPILKSPSIDYFSHRLPDSQSTTPYDARTPLASVYGRRTRESSESHSPKASWTNLTGIFNNSVLSLRGGTPPTPGSPVDRDRPRSLRTHSSQLSPQLEHPLPPSLPKSPIRISRQPSHDRVTGQRSGSPDSHGGSDKRSFAARQPVKPRTAGVSPNVTFGPAVAVIDVKASRRSTPLAPSIGPVAKKIVARFSEQNIFHQPTFWWHSDRAQTELELLRLAYADLLDRWGLDHQRVQVLKLCRSSTIKNARNYSATLVRASNGLGPASSVELSQGCTSCGTALQPPFISCSSCHQRQRPSLCTLCHLPILHLSQSCTICCHVGHLSCLQEWYSTNDACPTGCGCPCVAQGGTSGVFVPSAPAKPMAASAQKPRSSWGTLRNSLPYFSV